jgi:hypothetical protein
LWAAILACAAGSIIALLADFAGLIRRIWLGDALTVITDMACVATHPVTAHAIAADKAANQAVIWVVRDVFDLPITAGVASRNRISAGSTMHRAGLEVHALIIAAGLAIGTLPFNTPPVVTLLACGALSVLIHAGAVIRLSATEAFFAFTRVNIEHLWQCAVGDANALTEIRFFRWTFAVASVFILGSASRAGNRRAIARTSVFVEGCFWWLANCT